MRFNLRDDHVGVVPRKVSNFEHEFSIIRNDIQDRTAVDRADMHGAIRDVIVCILCPVVGQRVLQLTQESDHIAGHVDRVQRRGRKCRVRGVTRGRDPCSSLAFMARRHFHQSRLANDTKLRAERGRGQHVN